nr:hypothetical protein CFP56_24871 [Quercus suber]
MVGRGAGCGMVRLGDGCGMVGLEDGCGLDEGMVRVGDGCEVNAGMVRLGDGWVYEGMVRVGDECEGNAGVVKLGDAYGVDLVLHLTCPFQIASDRWLAYYVNTTQSMGPGSAWLIRAAFAAAILHKKVDKLVQLMETKLAQFPKEKRNGTMDDHKSKTFVSHAIKVVD